MKLYLFCTILLTVRSFYKHMLNLALTYEDLEAVDPEYYKQMKWTLEHDITDVLDQVLIIPVSSDDIADSPVLEARAKVFYFVSCVLCC